MANIIGTSGNDTLTATGNDDTIQGLAGNDTIIANNNGNDIIDGGTGKDVIDYSNLTSTVGISNVVVELEDGNNAKISKYGDIDYSQYVDTITNIETIIGSSDRSLNILNVSQVADTIVDVDLSANRVTYTSVSTGSTKILTVRNFGIINSSDINVGNGLRLKGDDLDNSISGNRGDTFFASKGNDTYGSSADIDYSKLGQDITISAQWNLIDKGSPRRPRPTLSGTITIDKSGFGKDKISEAPGKIIGAINKTNTLDVSFTNNLASLNVNLSKNSFEIIVSGSSARTYEIVNFTNFIGSKFNDTIVGANKKGKLTGGGGSDTITGGNKNDIITGSDSTFKGVGEVDTLTGGGGRDKFVLGDANGVYYVGKGKDDYATITDFNLFQDSIDLGGFKNYSFASAGNNTIELYSGKDVNTRDLIAKIQLAGGISSASSNSRSVMGSSQNLDSIISKIDVLSGASSIAETVV